jgi:hypothetical protein
MTYFSLSRRKIPAFAVFAALGIGLVGACGGNVPAGPAQSTDPTGGSTSLPDGSLGSAGGSATGGEPNNVASTTVATSPNTASRFQIQLLEDPTLDYFDIWMTPIDSLGLATTPWIDLGGIAYVDLPSVPTGVPTHFGINPSAQPGSALQAQLGTVPTSGRPFVITAGGTRIALGAFMRSNSTAGVESSTIIVETISDETFEMWPPTFVEDPMRDSRVVEVLSSTNKLVQ